MKALTLRLVTSFAFLGFSAASALAGSIAVDNGNFSTLPASGLSYNSSQGLYSSGVGIPGWTVSGDAGQWNNLTPDLASLPGSSVIGYSNGPTISQTVAPTVVVGDVYTLTVELGYRSDESFDGSADLLINGVTYDATGTPTLGGWATYTATYTGLAANAGDAITIQLNSTGGQGDFADVILTSQTPEPGSFYLAGLGLVCACGYTLRKSVA